MKAKIIVVSMLVLAVSLPAHAINRSAAARAEFMREHPCPATGKYEGSCQGYIVDHVQALACGGADAPSNMQWQTEQEAKAKDRWERLRCSVTAMVARYVPTASTPTQSPPPKPDPKKPAPTKGECGGKTHCGDMSSCAEARYYLTNCGQDQLDRDHDGIPCESICAK